MQRIPFDNADEISLRLSDEADDQRVRRLACTQRTSRIDGLIADMDETQRQILESLQRKIGRRTALLPGGNS